MKLDYTLSGYGLTQPPPDWLFYTNHQSHISRVYYVLEEGAGYAVRGERHSFMKNRLYVLPESLKPEYYLENGPFWHLFVDFSAGSCLNYDRVLCVDIEEYPLLKKDIEHFLFFVREKKIGYTNKFAVPQEFYRQKDRINFIISGLFSDIMEAFPIPEPLNRSISESVQYIHRHYRQEISIASLAKAANLSESYFSKLFLRAMGCTPYQYLKNYRFDMAISLLLSGFSVTETAEQCGFLSISAFSNSFKKKFGYPPNECLDFVHREPNRQNLFPFS